MKRSQIILASTSRYRRELLNRVLTDFQCESPNVDEQAFHSPSITSLQLAERLAKEKAIAVARRFPDAIVIGSDQLVDLDGIVLGKPGTHDGAVLQLNSMSGKSHRLLTAVCVAGPDKQVEFVNETHLVMRTLTDAEVARYVEHDTPFDCAGSYKIECLGISLFDQIETDDFTAIMGLPLIELSRVLRDFGVSIP